jgi:predicted DNA-binding transcriptional regulator YafY
MAAPSDRNKQIVRQWEILQLLEERPRSVSELAAAAGDAGVTRRTIYRDLEDLQAARFPVFSARDDDEIVRWRLLRNGVAPRRAA